MAIQWFPGHMHVARKEAAKTMESIDVIVEVLDARVPESSSTPIIAEWRIQYRRPCLKVLNKADLADPAVTKAWLTALKQDREVRVIAMSATGTGQADKIPSLCQSLAPLRSRGGKPLRVLIMGIPNVGKSTLMNALVKRRLARVGDEPAVTKKQQRSTLNKNPILIDSPGLLWPKITNPVVGLRLGTIQAIGRNVVVVEELAEFLAGILLVRYPGVLQARYGCDESKLDVDGVITAVAKKRGCLLKGNGGELNREKAASISLNELRKGMLGRISLEVPDETFAS